MLAQNCLKLACRTHWNGALVDDDHAALILTFCQQFGEIVGGVDVVTQVSGTVGLGGRGKAHENGVRALNHRSQVAGEKQVAVDVLGDDFGETGFVHILLDFLPFRRVIGGDTLLVHIVGVYFVTVFRTYGGMRKSYKSGSDDDDLHICPRVISGSVSQSADICNA